MYSYSYKQDRVEEVPPGKGEVALKIKGVVDQVDYKVPLFVGESGLPPGVLRSMLVRHSSLWGRYQ